MLAISSEAEEAVRGILDSDGIPDGAMLRISSEGVPESGSGKAGFAVSVLEEVPPEDQIVAGEEVEIAVEPVAAELLDDKRLEASVDGGQVQFSISDQGP